METRLIQEDCAAGIERLFHALHCRQTEQDKKKSPLSEILKSFQTEAAKPLRENSIRTVASHSLERISQRLEEIFVQIRSEGDRNQDELQQRSTSENRTKLPIQERIAQINKYLDELEQQANLLRTRHHPF